MFVCARPHFFILDNLILYTDAAHKPAIYLGFYGSSWF